MSNDKPSKFAKKKTADTADEGHIPGFAKKAKADKEAKVAAKASSKPTAKDTKKMAKTTPAKGPSNDERKITLLTKENPKREGSASHGRFELYRKSKTVGQFLEAGGTTADVRADEAAGHIQVAAAK